MTLVVLLQARDCSMSFTGYNARAACEAQVTHAVLLQARVCRLRGLRFHVIHWLQRAACQAQVTHAVLLQARVCSMSYTGYNARVACEAKVTHAVLLQARVCSMSYTGYNARSMRGPSDACRVAAGQSLSATWTPFPCHSLATMRSMPGPSDACRVAAGQSLSASTFCAGHSDGAYRHPSDCNQFFKCSGGRGVVDSCPQGLAFSPTFLLCQAPYYVPACRTLQG